MGFRCPCCHKDFGINKDEFMKHIKNCGEGFADGIVEMYTTGKNEKIKKYLKGKIKNELKS